MSQTHGKMMGWKNRHRKLLLERERSIKYLSKYVSRKMLRHSMRLSKYEQTPSCHPMCGASMIVDVSGFSKLAEALSSGTVSLDSFLVFLICACKTINCLNRW